VYLVGTLNENSNNYNSKLQAIKIKNCEIYSSKNSDYIRFVRSATTGKVQPYDDRYLNNTVSLCCYCSGNFKIYDC
jgi:hypothetical protein